VPLLDQSCTPASSDKKQKPCPSLSSYFLYPWLTTLDLVCFWHFPEFSHFQMRTLQGLPEVFSHCVISCVSMGWLEPKLTVSVQWVPKSVCVISIYSHRHLQLNSHRNHFIFLNKHFFPILTLSVERQQFILSFMLENLEIILESSFS
jgi:hypothetical protein